jgi:hypothetical protein
LGVKDGARLGNYIFFLIFVEQTTAIKEDIDPNLMTQILEGAPEKLSGVPQRQTQENDSIPKIAPKWLKHDR